MSEPLLIYIEHNFMTFWIFIFTLINTAILCGMFIAQLLNRRDFKKEQTKKQLEKMFNYYWLDTTNPDEDIPTGDTFCIPYEAAALFWNKYDTYEGVKPYGLKEFLAKIEKTDSGRLDASINVQTRSLANLIRKGELPRDTRKIAVESALLSLHMSTANAALVAYRLQLELQRSSKPESPSETPRNEGPTYQTEIQRLQEKWKKGQNQLSV